MNVSRSVIAQHYRSDGREKRGYVNLDDFNAMRADLDTTLPGFDPCIYPYRCAYCGNLHGGHPRPKNGFEKERFMVQEPLRSELGIRVLAHLGAENHPVVRVRGRAIRRRVRSGLRRG